MSRESWDQYFLKMAEFVATRSKDPSTKVGAVVVRPDKTVASLGYNGFARGVGDEDYRYSVRDLKYKLIVHAEINALVTAREPLQGYTLYVAPLITCTACAGAVIQAGIKRVVAWKFDPHDKTAERWSKNTNMALMQYGEAGVEFVDVERETGETDLRGNPAIVQLRAGQGVDHVAKARRRRTSGKVWTGWQFSWWSRKPRDLDQKEAVSSNPPDLAVHDG